MATVVVFEFSVMRCQPLRRALVAQWTLSIHRELLLLV
ncbi:iron transporter [Vibrio cholerae]|nr:iron transporter [Vibrio cholerae]EKF9707688.1 iron transporter [Vibrio cholerae]EKF9720841.1 iron transporter [Vibrio cholerae]EMA7656857.1 iron transporter [Vibrio cholerae]MCX9596655.1 iron transporter [Vibrio cholerae]HDG1518801.1 iron transporter [Vibrio cholerae]